MAFPIDVIEEYNMSALYNRALALNKLKSIDSNLLNIIELRFFAGFSLDEIANLLNTNKTKIYRQWLLAKSLLLNLIDENNG